MHDRKAQHSDVQYICSKIQPDDMSIKPFVAVYRSFVRCLALTLETSSWSRPKLTGRLLCPSLLLRSPPLNFFIFWLLSFLVLNFSFGSFFISETFYFFHLFPVRVTHWSILRAVALKYHIILTLVTSLLTHLTLDWLSYSFSLRLSLSCMTCDFHLKSGHFCVVLCEFGSYWNLLLQLAFSNAI